MPQLLTKQKQKKLARSRGDRAKSPSPAPYQYGWSDRVKYDYKTTPGLNPSVVTNISHQKNEPDWMLKKRHAALSLFFKKPLPNWGPDLSPLDLNSLVYYARPTSSQVALWDKLPPSIKATYEKIGVPQAEIKYLAGLKSQYDSEVIYGSLKKTLIQKGVIFTSIEEGLTKYPDLFKTYFGTVVPPHDNKFAALNSAVWSGGSFLYVPKNVQVDLPLQAYFRLNLPHIGQFERTLIIADEGSSVHYIEGCSAPSYTTHSLHSAVVEIIVKPNAHVRYSTIQNWSHNVYNLVTKRARVEKDGFMEWIDGNLGSLVTMKYPSCYLVGERARCEVLSLNLATTGQIQDTGTKCLHLAPHTSSHVVSKSVVTGSGQSIFRALAFVKKGASGSKTSVRCDTLLLDKNAKSYSFPHLKIEESDCSATHEAVIGKIEADQLFYLQARGLDEPAAKSLIVNGFLSPITKQLPFEYAIELNRLINLEMSESIG